VCIHFVVIKSDKQPKSTHFIGANKMNEIQRDMIAWDVSYKHNTERLSAKHKAARAAFEASILAERAVFDALVVAKRVAILHENRREILACIHSCGRVYLPFLGTTDNDERVAQRVDGFRATIAAITPKTATTRAVLAHIDDYKSARRQPVVSDAFLNRHVFLRNAITLAVHGGLLEK
jgi:hypothetical protein